VAEAAEWLLSELETAAVTTVDGNDVIAILNPPAQSEPIRVLASDFGSALAAKLSPNRVAIGLGHTVDGAAKLRRSLVEARHASSVAVRRDGNPSVATYEEISSHSLLLDLHDEDLLDTYRSALLGPILDYDARNGTELLRTLDTYLELGGHWQAVAARLKVHVNTLRYRLNRIEALTERDLREMEHQVDFYLALQIGRPRVASRQ
jgi:DNA-binding PucR family transcriptional regulator